jgi:guanosine-3',5'-bis(diphosphate) 3'-pyrophosphohydrolase
MALQAADRSPMAAERRVAVGERRAGDALADHLLEVHVAHQPDADLDAVVRAYAAAAEAHAGQSRHSGEPYLTHPVAVATAVAELGMDSATVLAALLHDAVEDTTLSIEAIEAAFGAEVAAMVDGVTKLDRVQFDSKEAQQAASMRKMLVAIAKDWRVLVIKLSDRLHNMATLGVMPEWKQRRIAQETLDVYAPLAHRLGMAALKSQLEDLAFAALYPKRYAEIDHLVASRAPERELYLAQVIATTAERLAEVPVEAEVTGRPKNLWSIYEKMVVKGRSFDEIYDLVGIRIVTELERDCWSALGSVHAMWRPVPGRFKDYINTPKFNLYQSLHTTVVGPQGKPLEIQIRTRDMHRRAEQGIAAHFSYKEQGARWAKREGSAPAAELAWLTRMLDWQRDTEDPAEFLEELKRDLDPGEVYVFTPKGKVVTLPSGSTPVDFAYAIHTEVGHHCIGARVNGRLVPLDSVLVSGDTVEVVTSKVPTAGPSQDWLGFVQSSRARNKIRQWFSRERREDALETGRDELAKELRRAGMPSQRLASSAELAAVAASLGLPDVDALFVTIGEGRTSARAVVQRLERHLRGESGDVRLPATHASAPRPGKDSPIGIYVEGLDDVMVRLSRCCLPVPGDPIVGFVTQGRGVSVHRVDCANALALASSRRERLIEVEWDRERSGVFTAAIEVVALDRSRLLSDVTRVLSEHHLNILSAQTQTGADRVARLRFEFELADPGHLDSVLGALRQVESVYEAFRSLPGRRSALG